MDIVLREIDKSDEKKAMEFAVKGMNLHRYVQGNFAMKLYARYFWYMEMERATQCIAAYVDGKFTGILLAEIKGEEHPYGKIHRRLYVRFMQWILNTFFHEGAGAYDEANRQVLNEYKKTVEPDGELIFLAADPDSKIKGIGTKLLDELTKREKGKNIYLYTDDGCTWQFYEHRGFDRAGERNICMEIEGRNVPIKCMLYSKKL